MPDQFSRTELLLGPDAMNRLFHARVAIFGVGGVGGYVAEALARSGIGAIDLIDNDTVSLTNLNRQILALHSTLGKYKVDVAEERIRDINPDCTVRTYKTFYMPETAGQFDFSQYDYVVDAIDTVTGKIELILQADKAGTPIISSMGAGNKLDASAFEVADIYETSICPLARVMRRELKKRGIGHLKVVYSKEVPVVPDASFSQCGQTGSGYPGAAEEQPGTLDVKTRWHCVSENSGNVKEQPGTLDVKTPTNGKNDRSLTGTEGSDVVCSDTMKITGSERNSSRRQVPGSTAFVPAAAGLIIAGEVVKDIAGKA